MGVSVQYRVPVLILATGMFVTLGIGRCYAQSQKIGYVDTQYILSKMPEYHGIQVKLEQMNKKWKNQIDSLQGLIDDKEKVYNAREILYSAEVKKQKEDEIQQLKINKQNFINQIFGADGEYYTEQKKLLKPLQQKVMQAVNNIAKKEGYDFIFDRSGDYSFLYTRPEWNISNDVLNEMGISVQKSGN